MLQAYGLTETAAAATATPAKHNVIGTVGTPIRGASVKIDSPDKDGVGEICIRGPILMKGYYRDEAATRAAIVDGWYHSGDLGRLEPDGSLVITGRSKDVIILANGKNVYPEELEAHYGQSPWIKEMCVLGISGPEGDERMRAFSGSVGVDYISARQPLCNADGCLTRVGPAASDVVTSDTVHLTDSGSVFLIKAIQGDLFKRP